MNEETFKILFGKNLKKIRKQKGFTQEKLAEKIGIETHNWNRIETGKTFPRSFTIVKIMEILELEPADIFGFEKTNINFDLKNKINLILEKNPDKAKDFYKILLALTEP